MEKITTRNYLLLIIGPLLLLMALLVTSADAQDSRTATGLNGHNVYLPYIFQRFPAKPLVPTLTISELNSENFTLSWTADSAVDQWTLQESTSADFGDSSTTNFLLGGATTSIAFSGKSGRLYYRVRGVNFVDGPDLIGEWSNVITTRIGNFTADKEEINKNECTTLRWSFTGVKAVHGIFGQGWGQQAVNGVDSRVVCPSITTTFQIIVTYTDDTQETFEVTVKVNGTGCNIDPYVNKFSSNKTSVNEGESFTISWEAECASTLFLEQTKTLENGSKQVTESAITGNSNTVVVFANDADKYEYRLKMFKRSPNQAQFIYSYTVTVNEK